MGDTAASYPDEYGCSYDSVNDVPQLFTAYAILYNVFNLSVVHQMLKHNTYRHSTCQYMRDTISSDLDLSC